MEDAVDEGKVRSIGIHFGLNTIIAGANAMRLLVISILFIVIGTISANHINAVEFAMFEIERHRIKV